MYITEDFHSIVHLIVHVVSLVSFTREVKATQPLIQMATTYRSYRRFSCKLIPTTLIARLHTRHFAFAMTLVCFFVTVTRPPDTC